jgi:hypothetical protein
MTTHDYDSETSPALTQVEPTTPTTNRGVEQSDLSTSADESALPTESRVSADQRSTAATDPGPAAADPGRAATDPGRHAQAQGSIAGQTEPANPHSPPAPESATNASESSGDLGSAPQVGTESSKETTLFADAELEELRTRWDDVQAGFVDDPKDCVQKADGLVSDVVEQLTSGFTEARSRLEQQWSRGEEASTEDLRVALKRYREFFDRLLAV